MNLKLREKHIDCIQKQHLALYVLLYKFRSTMPWKWLLPRHTFPIMYLYILPDNARKERQQHVVET